MRIEERSTRRGVVYVVVDATDGEVCFRGSKTDVYSFWLGMVGPMGYA